MKQLFRPGSTVLFRAAIVGVIGLVAITLLALDQLTRSPYMTMVGVAPDQPVPFSHNHHVAGLGLDCRYCHTSVEKTAFAGFPPTSTCMNCHSQIWNDAPMLAPVRESYRTGEPLRWEKVHSLPGFVYFNHSIHVAKGVGCSSCHGRIDKMPLVWKEKTLYMAWCLECHRNPEKFVRDKAEVFNPTWQPPPNQTEVGKQLVEAYHIRSVTNCSACHH